MDLCGGEPARHAGRGARQAQAASAAAMLGVPRRTLELQDRLIRDSVDARLHVARLLRIHRPRTVFTTRGAGVHPDHTAVTDIVVSGVFYARLPKRDVLADGHALDGTQPHEFERLFFGHWRMEPAWSGFDFAVDVSATYEQEMAAITVHESVFGGDQASLIDKYSAADRYVGRPVGVKYADAFKARSPLLADTQALFAKSRFGWHRYASRPTTRPPVKREWI